MTPRPDDHVRSLLGAFVLGHLEAGEADVVSAHIDGCAACREEAAELAPIAALLSLADAERVGSSTEPVPSRQMLVDVFDRINLERETRHRERRRSIARRVGAVAAALTLVGILAVATQQPASEQDPVSVVLTATLPGVRGDAVVHADSDATWVELTTAGLAPGETYAVWLEEGRTRERSPLGTFTGAEGDLYISLYSTLPRDRAASIGVSTIDGSTVMEGPIPDPAAS